MTRAEDDEQLRKILSEAKTIAVIGIKDDETEDAYRIPKYMQDHGARIIPVNPKVHEILGEKAYARLADVKEPIDLVNLFRAPEHIPGHAREILALPQLPKAVWMQLGIHHGGSAAELRAAGIAVVQDLCIMVEHRRLIGDGSAAER